MQDRRCVFHLYVGLIFTMLQFVATEALSAQVLGLLPEKKLLLLYYLQLEVALLLVFVLLLHLYYY